jgi:Na+-driven multidrug efflux pump
MGALITGIAYFCLGIPLTLLMVFKYEAGIIGIWCGPILATAFNTVMYITMF